MVAQSVQTFSHAKMCQNRKQAQTKQETLLSHRGPGFSYKLRRGLKDTRKELYKCLSLYS